MTLSVGGAFLVGLVTAFVVNIIAIWINENFHSK